MEEVSEVCGQLAKRRYRTVEEKRRIVEATLSSSASVASLARQYGLNANQLFHWRKLYHAGLLDSASSSEGVAARLLPITVDEQLPESTLQAPRQAANGTINIEFPGRALVSVEGCVDPDVIRVVLESLRR
jgi:transposase